MFPNLLKNPSREPVYFALAEWEKLYIGLLSIATDAEENIEFEKKTDFLIALRNRYSKLTKGNDFKSYDNIEIIAFTYAACVALSGRVRTLNSKYNEMLGRTGTELCISQIVAIAALILEAGEVNTGLLFDKERILNKYIITKKPGLNDYALLDTEIVLRPEIASTLMGSTYPLGDAGYAAKVYKEAVPNLTIAGRDVANELMKVYESMTFDQERGVLFLGGEEGVGRTFITRSMASYRGQELIVCDASIVESLDITDVYNILNKVIAKTIFDEAILYIRFSNDDRSDTSRQKLMLSIIMERVPQVLVSGSENLADELIGTETVHMLKKPAPDKAEQKEFFAYFAEQYAVTYADDVDMNEIVSLFNLTPDKIEKTVKCAQAIAPIEDGKSVVNSALLKSEIRKLCTVKFDKLATKLESSFTWDDIELSDISASKITEAMNRIRYKSVVNDEYGFEKRLPYGRGLTISLYGPPGTGKTMAANVIANELGMDIYRIDLSQISSKYIGESEKNLGAVFEAARYSNAILFFDEADALFSKRTDVSSSNDKHANTETAYLLQKMEEYPGVCILATNVISNFDAAFKRRITYMIPVEKLSEEMRYKLWLKVFPENTPISDDVNFEHYARLADLSGSGIKSAALSAAYRAAARGGKVTHADLCETIDEEYKKAGHTSILPSLLSLTI